MTPNTAGPAWMDLQDHQEWLRAEQDRLLQSYEMHALDSAIGFAPLDREGRPLQESPRELYATARLAHPTLGPAKAASEGRIR